MASCRACGAGVGRQFRFCSQCGSAVGVELDLLDLAPPAHDEATVTYGRPGRFWVAVGGSVVAFMLGLWALSSIGGGDGGAGTDDAGGGRPTTTRMTARAATATSPTDGAAATTATDGAAATTTSTRTPSTSVLAGGGPLPGQPLGLSLIIGSEERLRRLDLDTGVVTTYERAGLPLFATGDVVLVQGSGSMVRALPLAELDADVSPLWAPYSPAVPRPGPKPGQIWLPDVSDESLSWRLVDAGGRDVIRELDGDGVPWWMPGVMTADPLVVGSSTGEVFERDVEGGGLRRVADGELVSVGRSLVLVRRCADPTACTLHWLDRASWREVERPLPDVDARTVSEAYISDDGRLLQYGTAMTGTFLFDVGRGAPVAEVSTWPDNLAVSPDGRWVAMVHVAGRVAIYDVERGELNEIPVSVSASGASRLVIVPTV